MIKVYFESNSHAELVATFESEEVYALCIKPLEKDAKSKGMKLTESVEEEGVFKLPIYWSVEDFEGMAETMFKGLKDEHSEEFKSIDNWEQLYDKTKFPQMLEKMIKNHDANEGITWQTIEFYVGLCEIKN